MTKMIRPKWYDVYLSTSAAYTKCRCGEILQTDQSLFEHWAAGHFDYAVDEVSEVTDKEEAEANEDQVS